MNKPVQELERGLKGIKKTDYNTIDRLMKGIGKKYNVNMKKLHNDFVQKNKESPDSWIKRRRGETNKKTTSCGCSVNEQLKKNLTPEEIARKHGVSVNKIEKQLSMGIKIEKEHTDNIETAKKIALQHLAEFPDYYTKLKKMETKKTFKEFVEIVEAKTPAWQRSAGKNPEGGLNRKGIKSYRDEHPESKLSLAVTTKPSKLKKGSKKWKRRKSFCARSAGQMKMWPKAAKDPNSRLRLARKKWNC